jgi:hypothetical protein
VIVFYFHRTVEGAPILRAQTLLSKHAVVVKLNEVYGRETQEGPKPIITVCDGQHHITALLCLLIGSIRGGQVQGHQETNWRVDKSGRFVSVLRNIHVVVMLSHHVGSLQ